MVINAYARAARDVLHDCMHACSPKAKTKDLASLYTHVSMSSPHLATRFCSKKLEHHINHVL